MDMTDRSVAEIVRALGPRWLKRSLPEWLKARIKDFLDQRGHEANRCPRPSATGRLRNGCTIRWEDYDRMWSQEFGARPANQLECFRLHKVRYYELFNTMVEYLAGRAAPRVLDIGTSEFLPLYKRILPQMELITIDRPTDQHGFDPRYALERGGALRHYSVDLNQVRLMSAYGTAPLGVFDYILCTEVLEHLLVNPVEILEDLIGLLKPGGYLYLTTPNFFSHRPTQVLARRENPQAIFHRRG